jgi:hypothetical protein
LILTSDSGERNKGETPMPNIKVERPAVAMSSEQ